MSGRYTILLEGKISQVSLTSRRPLQDYKLGINADISGIRELLLTIAPNTTASIPSGLVYFSLISSDILRIVLHSVNPANQTVQSTTLDVNRVFTIASPLTGVDITNNSSVNVVECRVIYS